MEQTKKGYSKSYLVIGPIYTIKISDKIVWDIKPQITLESEAYFYGSESGVKKIYNSSFIFGNSLVFGRFGKGFNFTINLDYLYMSPNQLNYINNFDLGLGMRYNFFKKHKKPTKSKSSKESMPLGLYLQALKTVLYIVLIN